LLNNVILAKPPVVFAREHLQQQQGEHGEHLRLQVQVVVNIVVPLVTKLYFLEVNLYSNV